MRECQKGFYSELQVGYVMAMYTSLPLLLLEISAEPLLVSVNK